MLAHATLPSPPVRPTARVRVLIPAENLLKLLYRCTRVTVRTYGASTNEYYTQAGYLSDTRGREGPQSAFENGRRGARA